MKCYAKNWEDNQKAKKIGRVVSQMPTPSPKQDQIWAQWPKMSH